MPPSPISRSMAIADDSRDGISTAGMNGIEEVDPDVSSRSAWSPIQLTGRPALCRAARRFVVRDRVVVLK